MLARVLNSLSLSRFYQRTLGHYAPNPVHFGQSIPPTCSRARPVLTGPKCIMAV